MRFVLWEEPISLDLLLFPRFYGALLGSVCILYLLPLCWVMAILNSTLFLGNSQFYQGKGSSWRVACMRWVVQRPFEAVDSVPILCQ